MSVRLGLEALEDRLAPATLASVNLSSNAPTVNTNQPLVLTALVSGPAGSRAPTGTVSFQNGNTVLGSATLNASGQGTFITTGLPAGSDSLTVSYAGDAAYQGALSAPVFETVNAGSPYVATQITALNPTGTGLVSTGAPIVNVQGSMYFTGTDGQLWTSDGTAVGTIRLTNFPPAGGVAGPVNANGTLYFLGNDGHHGWQVWTSNGTVGGTAQVTHVNGALGWANPINLTSVNGKLLLTDIEQGNASQIWATDGSAAGAGQLTNIGASDGYLDTSHEVATNNLLLVPFYGSSGLELWKSDGTAAGSGKVASLTGTNGDSVQGAAAVNGMLFLAVYSSDNGFQLWKSDGTAAGTQLASPRQFASISGYGNFASANGKLFFVANDGTHGNQLWVSDGTSAGTVALTSLSGFSPWLAPTNGSPGAIAVNGALFFEANGQLWKSDGTAAGTMQVTNVNTANGGLNPTYFTTLNNTVLFAGFDGGRSPLNEQIWQSDGTASGTIPVTTNSDLAPTLLTNVGGTIYFDGAGGSLNQLWKLTPAAQTTTRVNLSSSSLQASLAQNVTFTATVTGPGGQTPTGQVTFLDGSISLGIGYLDGTGKSTFRTTLAAGDHNIVALYTGDGSDPQGASGVLDETIAPAPSSVSLATSSTTTTFGQAVTLTAAVTGIAGANAPTGTVTFLDGSATLGTGTLGANGQATFTTTQLNVGARSLTAVYAGNGNYQGSSSQAVTQTVNAASNSWSDAGAMSTPREFATATLLGNGKVLVSGGGSGGGVVLASAELYDPASNTWSAAPAMSTAREGATATLLGNGKVLVAGGAANGGYLASAELYDPASNTWSAAPPLSTARWLATATLLGNGKALVASGANSGGRLASAELYDPASNTWSATPAMSTVRGLATATLLGDGKVLVSGGSDTSGYLASAELYDPASNTWSAASAMSAAREGATATLLDNGKVLVTGGGVSDHYLSSAELYDPASNTWSAAPAMSTARAYQTATLLGNGNVLVAGGGSSNGILASAELYTPATRVTAPPAIATTDAVFTYGQAASTTVVTATSGGPSTFSATGLPSWASFDASTGVLSGTPTAAAPPQTVTITATNTAGLAAVANLTLTVHQAALTVTANDATRASGQANPAFTATYAGFVNGDGAGSLGGALTFTTAATAASSVGAYAVTPSGLTSANYAIAFVPGTLTIHVAPVAAPPGLVAWWAGNGDTNDGMGGQAGSLSGNAGFVAGKVGQAFQFDGQTSEFQAPATYLPTGNADRTLEAWVRLDALPSGEAFLAGYGGFGSNGQSYALGTLGDGSLFFSQWGGALVGPQLAVGQWHHVAVTNTGDQVTLYLDGTAVASGALDINTAAGTNLYAGRLPGSLGDDRRLTGAVDEISVYNRALTPAEIQAIFNADSAGKQAPAAPTALSGGPYHVAAGGSVTLAGSALDPAGGTLSYSWDFHYNGTTFNVEATGATPTFDAPASASPSTRTIALRVDRTDGGGALYSSSVVTTTVHVLAVPTVSVTAGPFAFDGNGHGASTVTVADAGTGSIVASLGDAALSYTYYAGRLTAGQLAGATPLASAPVGVGTYTVVARYAGDNSAYGPADSAPVTYSITPGIPTLTVSDSGPGGSGASASWSAHWTIRTAGGGPVLASNTGASALFFSTSGAQQAQGPAEALIAILSLSSATQSPQTDSFARALFTATLLLTDNASGLSQSFTFAGEFNGRVSSQFVSLDMRWSGPTSVVANLGSHQYTVSVVGPDGLPFYGPPPPPDQPEQGSIVADISVSDLAGGGTWNGSAFPATATVNGGASLEGVAPTLTYYQSAYTSPDQLAAVSPLAGPPTSAGTYTVLASFAGSADYKIATALTTFTIAPATPTVAVSDAGGTWSSEPFDATATVAGVDGKPVSALEGVGLTLDYQRLNSDGTVFADLASAAPTAAGNYRVTVSFAGSADYAAASASSSFTISPAAPTVTVEDAGGTYSGQPFAATAEVAGLDGTTDTMLEGVGLTLDYQQLNPDGTASADLGPVAPTAVGSYRGTASFAGSADYAAARASATFSIGLAGPSVTVADAGGTYAGAPFAATATVAGVAGNALAALEGVGLTLDYQRLNPNGTVLADIGPAAPTAAGDYEVTASFAGSADYAAASASATFAITTATATVSVADAGGTYGGQPFAAMATVVGVDGTTAGSLEGAGLTLDYQQLSPNGTVLADLGTAAPTAAGTYQVTASFAGSTDYAPATDFTLFTVSAAAPTVRVTDASGTWNGQAFAASPTVAGVDGQPVGSLEGVGLTLDYQRLSPDGTVSADLGSAAPTAVGNYQVTASFAGSADYAAATDATLFTISQAMATIGVADAGGTWNGQSFAATGALAGVDGKPVAALEGVGLTLDYLRLNSDGTSTDLGAHAPTGAGSYDATASFAGSADYASGSTDVAFTIATAMPTLSVMDAGGTWNGRAYSATTTLAGLNGRPVGKLEGVGLTLDYQRLNPDGSTTDLGAVAPTAAGNYQVTASFTGSADYAAASATTAFSVKQATPAIRVTDAGGTWNGRAFAAVATVNGGTTLEGARLTLDYQQLGANGTVIADLGSTPPTAAGTYKVTASFAGSMNYAPASASASFTIKQATPTVRVTDAGGTWSGRAFGAIATLNGVATLEGVGLTLDYQQLGANGTVIADLGSTPPTAAGNYKVTASFAGSADYASASASASFTIKQATPSFSRLSSPSVKQGTAPTFSGKLAAAALVPVGANGQPESVQITVSNANASVTIHVTASVNTTTGAFSVALSTAQLSQLKKGTTYKIAYSFLGDINFSAASGTGSLTIT